MKKSCGTIYILLLLALMIVNTAYAQDSLMLWAGRGTTYGLFSITPDGRHIISGNNRGYRLWDREQGTLIATHKVSNDNPISNGGVITHDGRAVVLITSKGALIQDIVTGDSLGFVGGEAMRKVEFSPDGTMLLISGYTAVHILRYERLVTIGYYGSSNAAAFSPDSRYIACSETIGSNDRLVVRDAVTGNELWADTVFYNSVSYADSGRVIVAYNSHTIGIYDAESGELLDEVQALFYENLNTDPYSRYIVTVRRDWASDTTMNVYDIDARKRVATWPMPYVKGEYYNVLRVPGSDRIIVTDGESVFKEIDFLSNTVVRQYPDKIAGDGLPFVMSADGSTIASGVRHAGHIGIASGADGELLRSITMPWPILAGLALNANGSLLAASTPMPAAGVAPAIRVFDTRSGEEVKSFDVSPRAATALAFVGIDRLLAADDGGTVRLYSVTDGSLEATYSADTATVILDVVISRDGSTIAAVDDKGKIFVWDRASRALHRTLPARGQRFKIALTGDGKRLVTGRSDSTYRVWQIDDSTYRELTSIRDVVAAQMVLSQNDSVLVVGSDDVLLVDVNADTIIRRLIDTHAITYFSYLKHYVQIDSAMTKIVTADQVDIVMWDGQRALGIEPVAGLHPVEASTSGVEFSVRPNPASERTEVWFRLDLPLSVTITIYDAQGRIVSRPLADALHEAGEHRIAVQTDGLPAGVYQCSVNAGGVERTVQLVVVR